MTAFDEAESAILAEVPAFRASANPDILPGLRQHLADLAAQSDPGFAKSYARKLAEQRFPLEAILQAYGIAGRMTQSDLSAFSIAAAAEYVAHTRLLAETEGDRRTELLNTLLSGYDESDQRVARLLKRAGYLEQRQSYCVVVIQPTIAAEMEHAERAQRIIAAVSDALAQTSVRILAGARDTVVIAILSDRRRQSGWTEPEANLASRVHPLLDLLGPAVLTGISAAHPSTSYLPRAFAEATMALDFASVSNRVVQFASLPVRALLVHKGANDLRTAPPPWIHALTRANPQLIETLRAIADCDMNMQQAARKLCKHPNTLYARLVRVKELTGLDGQRYHDLTELLLAADCWPT